MHERMPNDQSAAPGAAWATEGGGRLGSREAQRVAVLPGARLRHEEAEAALLLSQLKIRRNCAQGPTASR